MCEPSGHDFDIFILGPEKSPTVTLFCKKCGKTADVTPKQAQSPVIANKIEVPIE